ncbi:transcriptional regulator [Hydrococcus rivularis NIES-593]|uniref:Transcriptional regulator n=1 Tax=Hydrococcus rivularis NIES-593 TaxID=1921803 RepID=A0A1U7HGS0_9CYAN|nr:Rrf2 family transcriptional regulator [Hydrococcus rivularis]OKH22783.1 transcriptional regulator [Hydrococcus rivularis NIES-593]
MMNTDADRRNYILLELPSKVEYALLALLELASHPGKTNLLTISEISTRQNIPDRYLEHIFTSLRRGGLVQSLRGSRGGYILAREPWQITVLEVVALVEGDRKQKESDNSIDRALVAEIWQKANHASLEILNRYTLQDLCQRRDALKQEGLMYYI